MARPTISRTFDPARILKIVAQKLSGESFLEFFDYFTPFCEQVLRILRGALTFKDNMASIQPTVSLTHNTSQIVNTDGKIPVGIIPIKVISTSSGTDSFAWYVDEKSQVTVKITFTGSPTGPLSVVLLILFG